MFLTLSLERKEKAYFVINTMEIMVDGAVHVEYTKDGIGCSQWLPNEESFNLFIYELQRIGEVQWLSQAGFGAVDE
jgi:hypothetical protein